MTAATHATGWGPADIGARIFFVLITVLAASRAKAAPVLVLAAVVAAAATPGAAWLGFAAIGVAVAGTAPSVRAIAGGLLGNGLLHAGWPGGQGRTAVLAALVLLVLVLATDAAFIRRAGLVGSAFVAVGLGLTGAAAMGLSSQQQVATQAIDAGQRGLDAARDGRADEAQTQFDQAAQLLAGVEARLGKWWMRPALAVPAVGANLEQLQGLVAVARDIATSGAVTARSADVSRLTPADGAIDLATMRSFAAPLATLDATLTRAGRDLDRTASSWTIPALTHRMEELRRKITRAQTDTDRARQAVTALPAILGGDTPRRYFLAVMTPAELRGGGGFVGNWGIVAADDGRLTLPRFGRISELYSDGTPYAIHVDPEYDDRYVRGWALGRYPQNILASPDLPSNAVAIDQILRQAGEGPVDGILVVDPYGIAALLQLTGPIDVAGWPEPLTAANVAKVLLFDQYVEFANDPSRPDLLARTAKDLFSRLTTGTLASASVIGRELGEAAEGGHLQFASLRLQDRPLLTDLGLDHALRAPIGDSFGIVGQNAAPSKLDWFLRRSVHYDVRIDRSGAVVGTVTVTLTNSAPPHGLPVDGYQYLNGKLPLAENVHVVSLYTALTATRVTEDGAVVEFSSSQEREHRVFDRFVTLPAGATSTLRFEVEGRLPLRDHHYRLDVHHQPTAVPDELTITVNGRALFDGPLVQDLVLRTFVP